MKGVGASEPKTVRWGLAGISNSPFFDWSGMSPPRLSTKLDLENSGALNCDANRRRPSFVLALRKTTRSVGDKRTTESPDSQPQRRSRCLKELMTATTLVPEPERPDQSYFYRRVIADDNGQFTIPNLAPGDYVAYAWDDLPADGETDSEIQKRYRDQASPISIKKKSTSSVTLPLIHSGE